MKVGRYDYPAQLAGGLDEAIAAMRAVLLDADHGVDGVVAAFEREFAAYVGARFAVGVNTGTDALVLSLRAAGIGPGDAVLTQANTFHATVAAIVLCGARPVLVDADAATSGIDLDLLEAAVDAETRAIVPVHLHGRPAPIAAVCAIAARVGACVVEDAAQAHGARVGPGRHVGTFGCAGCFSFHPSKNLAAAGDGGMVVTDDGALAADLRARRALGQRAQNDHVLVGLNSKLHPLEAVVLRAKLPMLDAWNELRRELARRYRAALAGLPLAVQQEEAGAQHVYHLFQIRTPARDALLRHLRAAGIDAVVRYPVPVHLQPAFARFGWARGDFPVAEALAAESLCLPLYPGMPEDAFEYVVESVRLFFDTREGACASEAA